MDEFVSRKAELAEAPGSRTQPAPQGGSDRFWRPGGPPGPVHFRVEII